MTDRRHVVIVGGGFAGLAAARTLARHRSLRVTVIDRTNHQLFQPLLYQVATAASNPSVLRLINRANYREYIHGF